MQQMAAEPLVLAVEAQQRLGDRQADQLGLRARLDPAWRAGEWDGETLLFSADLDSARTTAWSCRTPGCPTATRRTSGRCDGCRRARVSVGLSWTEFDSAPPRATHPPAAARELLGARL